MKQVHDVIIIGGGPGGYTAALYSSRAGLDTLVLEKLSSGGQMAQTTQIDNYPGFEEGIDGFLLGEKMQAGAERFGAKSVMAEVFSVNLTGKIKEIETDEGTYLSKTVIIAAGADHRRLGLQDEEGLTGRGVHYCAACDGMFYKDKTVAVIGGGNSAVADALILSRICKKVYIVHRRDTLRATKVYHKQLERLENVEFIWNSAVSKFISDDRLKGLELENLKTGEQRELPVDGVFISVGRRPVTEIFKDQLQLDNGGYIIADESTQTSIPGVYAVGDIRTKAVRQVVTAAADGAVAVHYADEYIASDI